MNKKGFTLIELIVSIVLVSVVLVSLLGSLLQIRNAYNTIHENSDVIVYSSSIARVINNDLSANNGIRYVSCENDGKKCYLILGNDDRRELTLTEKTDTIPSDPKVTRENVKTTISYTNTTKYNKTNNEDDIKLIYIRTLEMDKYTKYRDETKTSIDKITANGFTFYDMSASQYEYFDEDDTSNLIDVFTTIRVRLYDGVDANISKFDIKLYGAGKYDYSNYIGKKYTINLDNKITANGGYAGTTTLTVLFGVGYFKGEGTNAVKQQINQIDVPINAEEGATPTQAFVGYFYKPAGLDVETQIIDASGNIIASSRLFKSDELDGNVYAKWAPLGPGYRLHNGKIVPEDYTITFNKNGGSGGDNSKTVMYGNLLPKINIPYKSGYLFTGYNDESGTQQYSNTGVGKSLYYTPSDSTYTAQWSPCAAGTYTPSGQNKCEECVKGSVSNAASGACTPCQGGKTTSGAGQTECNANCSNTANVSSWKSASWSNNTMTNLCTIETCVNGYNLSSNACVANKYYVKYDKNADTAVGTMSNSTHTYNTESTLTANVYGRIGFTFNGWNTLANGSGTSYADKAKVKTLTTENGGIVTLYAQWTANTYDVSAGYYLKKGATASTKCPVGYYCPGGALTFSETANVGLKTCPSGYTSASGKSAQSDCYYTVSAGNYLKTKNTTTTAACAAGTAKGEHNVYYGSVSSCDDCAAGTYTSTTGQTSCTTCSAGTYNTGTKNTGCTTCESGYYCSGGSNRAACPAGTKGSGTGKSSQSAGCTSCAAGTYQPNTGQTSCLDCTAGTASSAGASSCTNCGPGKYSSTAKATSCSNCPAGKYSSGEKNSSCSSCSAGTYSGAGASGCTTCGSGKTSGSGASSCTSCSAGTYANSSHTQCVSCSAGTYSGTGASSCTTCGTNQISAAGASSCTTCGSGTAANSDHTQCVSCSAGTYFNGSSCVTCDDGKTSVAGATSCTTCANGKYANSSHTSCVTCEAGYYCTGGRRYQCANGKYSSSGASSCTTCSAGTYSNTARTSCVTCPAGSYCTNGIRYVCPGGTFNTTTANSNSSSCATCTAGYYCTSGNRYTCPQNTISSAGATSCTTCAQWTTPNSTRTHCDCTCEGPKGKICPTDTDFYWNDSGALCSERNGKVQCCF